MTRPTVDELKVARDGHLSWGAIHPTDAPTMRPVWDRIVVKEWDGDGNPTRWTEEIDGMGAVEFTGRISRKWLAEMGWRGDVRLVPPEGRH